MFEHCKGDGCPVLARTELADSDIVHLKDFGIVQGIVAEDAELPAVLLVGGPEAGVLDLIVEPPGIIVNLELCESVLEFVFDPGQVLRLIPGLGGGGWPLPGPPLCFL